MSAPKLAAEYVSIVDDDDHTWRWQFNLTFFLSAYTCIWGQGCPSIENDGSLRGCCTHGVFIVDGEDHDEGRKDLARIRRRVRALTDADWQNKALVDRRGGVRNEESWLKSRGDHTAHTRVHKGACIFHNRPDHPAGAGCAFHVAAMRRGEDPIDWKPETCWMVPLRQTLDEKERVFRVEPYYHHNWGEGEEPNEWWCIDAPEAYVGEEAAFRTMEGVLRRICGDAVYEAFAEICEQRLAARPLKPLPMHTPVRWIGLNGVEPPDGSTGFPKERDRLRPKRRR